MTTTHLIPGATIGRRALLKGGTCTAVAAFGFGTSHAQAPTKITITYPTRSGATWSARCPRARTASRRRPSASAPGAA